MRIKFYTKEYEFSHGRKPRGWGAHAFDVSFVDEQGVTQHTFRTMLPGMTLTEAKKVVRGRAIKELAEVVPPEYEGRLDIEVEVLP